MSLRIGEKQRSWALPGNRKHFEQVFMLFPFLPLLEKWGCMHLPLTENNLTKEVSNPIIKLLFMIYNYYY